MIVALLTLVAQNSVSLPAAYYTVDELAAALRKQHQNVVVAPSVGDEVFVIRSEDTTWESLRQALISTGRVSIANSDGTWKITRSEADKAIDALAARRYVEHLRSKIEWVYGSASQMADHLSKASDEEMDQATDRLGNGTGKSPEIAARDQLVYLVACERDRPLQDITVPWMLSTNKADPFGRTRLTDLWKDPQLMLPDGDIRNFRALGDLSKSTPEELRRVGSSIQFGGKLTFEPLTITTGCRIVLRLSSISKGQVEMANCQLITPETFRIRVTPEQVWTKTDLATIQSHWSNAKVESRPVIDSVLPLPTSQAVLRWAEINHRNVVLPVSAMADLVIPARSTGDLPRIVEANNSMQVDGSWINELASERVDPSTDVSKPNLEAFTAITITSDNAFLSFQNDLDFLDELVSGDPSPATSFLNISTMGRLPPALDVCRMVAKIPILNWRNGRFASGYLRYCNPISFRPFAVALLSSDNFAKSVKELPSGGHLKLNLADLQGGEAPFKKAISEAGDLNDAANEYSNEPSSVAQFLQDSKEILTLRVDRTDGTYSFGLYDDERPIWLSWIRGIQF